MGRGGEGVLDTILTNALSDRVLSCCHGLWSFGPWKLVQGDPSTVLCRNTVVTSCVLLFLLQAHSVLSPNSVQSMFLSFVNTSDSVFLLFCSSNFELGYCKF